MTGTITGYRNQTFAADSVIYKKNTGSGDTISATLGNIVNQNKTIYGTLINFYFNNLQSGVSSITLDSTNKTGHV